MRYCACGKGARFYSSLLDAVFCSEDCYKKAGGGTEETVRTSYVGHGHYAEYDQTREYDADLPRYGEED